MRVANKIIQNGQEIKLHPKTIALVDYIVEQGSNYTKWNSGKLECWGRSGDFPNPTSWSTSGGVANGKIGSKDISLPVSFVGTSIATATINNSNPWSISWVHRAALIGTSMLNISIASIGGGYAHDVNYYIVGRWK